MNFNAKYSEQIKNFYEQNGVERLKTDEDVIIEDVFYCRNTDGSISGIFLTDYKEFIFGTTDA